MAAILSFIISERMARFHSTLKKYSTPDHSWKNSGDGVDSDYWYNYKIENGEAML